MSIHVVMAHSRSPSPQQRLHHSSRSKSQKHTGSRREMALPPGAEEISEDDYFLKSAEFRRWLREEKGKYFDDLTAEKSRGYFRKFVKAWNRGKLKDEQYIPVEPGSVPSNTQTSYKWSFASNRSRVDTEELRRVRESVGADTQIPHPPRSNMPFGLGRMQGPTLPSASDLQLAREDAAALESMAQSTKRKRERAQDNERIEDMVGPKEMGREGMLEKKRLRAEGNKAFRDAKEEGVLELSDNVLMGSGGSFQEAVARRDAARSRFDAKRREQQQSKLDEKKERAEQIKEKDRQTMEMFKKLAKERFG